MDIETIRKMTVSEFLAKASEFGFDDKIVQCKNGTTYKSYRTNASPVMDNIGCDMFNEEAGEIAVYDAYGNYTGNYETVYIVSVKATSIHIGIYDSTPNDWIQITVSFEYNTTDTNRVRKSFIEYNYHNGAKDWTIAELIDTIEDEISYDIKSEI